MKIVGVKNWAIAVSLITAVLTTVTVTVGVTMAAWVPAAEEAPALCREKATRGYADVEMNCDHVDHRLEIAHESRSYSWAICKCDDRKLVVKGKHQPVIGSEEGQ